MELNREPIRNWFGFTRRERSSSFILLLIIVLTLGLRYTVPQRNIDIEDITSSFSAIGNSKGSETLEMPAAVPLFSFDPNTSSFDSLIMLGLGAKEARTVINYRSKGGKFRKPSDIKKIYGIEEGKADRLIPFVEIRTDTPEKVLNVTGRQQKLLIDINSCDSATLVALYGIGPVLSARIIKYRRLLGGFAGTEQLKEVYGLPEETFNLIKGSLFADTSALTRINVNSAGYKELARLPYFEKYEVTAILKYRELKGTVNGINDLIDNKLISEAKANKVKPYLNFE